MKIILMAAAATAVFVGMTGVAHAQNWAAGAGVGTAGWEVQGAYKVNDSISLRASGNFMQFDAEDVDGEDVTYSGEFDANTLGAFVDWHPLQNGFTVTGGAYFGARDINLSAAPTSNVEIGGTTYTPAQVGTLDGTFALGDTAPYLGIGYDSTFIAERIGFRAALGVAFGDPEAELTSSSGLVSGADLEQEEQQIEEDGDALKYYPVLSIGFSYRF